MIVFVLSFSEPVFKFGKSGILGKGKDAVSKHDPQICGRRNASRVMDVSFKVKDINLWII
jgi:hypothetical protein